MKNMKNLLNKQKMEILGSALMLAIFVLPSLSFAGSRNDIYVDRNAKGKETGSASNPYHTISEALAHANSRTDVHIAKGEYVDNIEIPRGVNVYGTSDKEVVIKARNKNKVVVSMKDKTEINKVTIKDGKNGIWVKDNAKVSIIEVIVRDNEKDGIKIGEGKISDKEKVSITDSTITENGKSGIYSQKRRLVMIDNEITDNDNDGIDLAAGTKAWLEDNSFKDNRGSGVKLTLDGSEIWTKNNSMKKNGREGLEVNAYGKTGRIDINKSEIIGNENFGISRVQRAGALNVWGGFTVQDDTVIESNKLAAISPARAVK